MRTILSKSVEFPQVFKTQILEWAQQFNEVVFLDSNEYHQKYSSYDWVLAVDAFTAIQTDSHQAFEALQQYQQVTQDWLFGYLSYDLKNDTERLTSANFDGLQFPELFFFQPKKLFLCQGNTLEIHYLYCCDDELESDWEAIRNQQPAPTEPHELSIQQRIPKDRYLSKIETLLQHIQRGDIYEANFCMEFFAEQADINPVQCYNQLNAISSPPFATFLKNKHHYVLSASPERYLRKQGPTIISQPIKGTAKRYADPIADEQSKTELANNPKERSENIMIVDLVRNDLSRTAIKASVAVEELCGIYSFPQVHQMISTIVSEIDPATSPAEVLKTTFPMGSMTGAPKISAMTIIETLEETKRGVYSGAVGYFTPNHDFDFNVIIRSILYNAHSQYLSFSVGSAITIKSVPEQEYEECLLKAKAMFEVLQ